MSCVTCGLYIHTHTHTHTHTSTAPLLVALSQLHKKQAARCRISVQFVSYQRVPELYYHGINNLFFTLRVAACLSYIKRWQKSLNTERLNIRRVCDVIYEKFLLLHVNGCEMGPVILREQHMKVNKSVDNLHEFQQNNNSFKHRPIFLRRRNHFQ
jgi:hypothetical protein